MPEHTLKTDPWAHRVARLALAAVFVAAALPKLVDPTAFAVSLEHYRMLPAGLVGPIAVSLPVLELAVAAALMTRAYTAGGALLGAILLCAFAIAMAQAELRGIDLACGCFGAEASSPVSWWKVLADVGGAIVAGWICLSRRGGWRRGAVEATNFLEGST